MATRMQQRRGTAAQWSAANPVLAAGEIGFVTDTGQFKIGDGVNTWSSLGLFKDFGDLDTNGFLTDSEKGQPNGVATLNAQGQIPIGQLALIIAEAPEAFDTLAELGAAATSILGTVNTHNAKTTDVHGIVDTNELVTNDSLDARLLLEIPGRDSAIETAKDNAVSEAGTYTDGKIADEVTNRNLAIGEAISDHNDATENIHGIGNTALLATKEYADDAADAAELAATTAAASAADTKVSDHNLDTTNVHGITNTADLATKSYADTAEADAITAAGTAADTKIADAVAALTKSSVGLANVDNTADADKPVSTATQAALDLKANLAGPTFTGTSTTADLVVNGDFTVNGTNFAASATSITIEDNMLQLAHQNAANTVDLGLVVAYNDGTAKHSGLVRDVSDAKWKLFKGVTSEPTTTVDFTQGSLDDLKVAALEATTVTPSDGIVFSDGTQTKVGVPSITAIGSTRSSSETLSSGEQDKFVPISGSVTITLPSSGYSTGQSIDFWQSSGTGAQFAGTGVVGTPGLKFRTTYSVATAMKIDGGWLVFGDLSA